VSVSFTLNGITSAIVSSGTLGYFGGGSGGLIEIHDPSDGGSNYLAADATTADGMERQSIGALFGTATLFSACGGGDPAVAIGSLGSIGGGSGLVSGGVTYMSPDEHLDARILGIDVPSTEVFGIEVSAMHVRGIDIAEPGGLTLLVVAVAGLALARLRVTG
jgi:hypothetical protein